MLSKSFFRLLLVLGLFSGATVQAQTMPVSELTVGFYRIETEVAATPEHRQVGLMNRQQLPTGRGMMFVFTEDNTHCMWMRNTLIPLSVAFLDPAGKIINIEDMQPRTENNHCAKQPARYALEMNQGWFKERGIRPGMALGGLQALPRAR